MNRSFIFPGQGSQVVGMAKEFYDSFSFVREMFEIAADVLKKDMKKIMFTGPDDLLKETENAQPAIMLASAVMLETIKKESGKNIQELCNFVAGHSLGEYSALYACESITLEEALKLLHIRGKSFAEAGKKNNGSMLALIGSTIEQAEKIAEKAEIKNEILQVANDNTVGQVVLSGNINSIKNAIKISEEFGVKRAVELNVSGAFHSKLMEPAVKNMSEILDSIDFKEPKVNFIANYTANKSSKNTIKQNLISQITDRVKWRETMLLMEKGYSSCFVEIGSGKVLSGMVARTCQNVEVKNVNSLATLNEFIEILINKV